MSNTDTDSMLREIAGLSMNISGLRKEVRRLEEVVRVLQQAMEMSGMSAAILDSIRLQEREKKLLQNQPVRKP